LKKRRKRKPKTVTTPNPGSTPRARFFFRRISLRVPFLCLAIPCLTISLLARPSAPGEPKPEKPYALIYGTVFGPDNHSVYGVKVKIRRADQKKAQWELYSDHAGEFAQRVPAGQADYVISADPKGCKVPQCKGLRAGTDVTVHIQNDERADVGVHLTK
jgi:hypothetical protein